MKFMCCPFKQIGSTYLESIPGLKKRSHLNKTPPNAFNKLQWSQRICEVVSYFLFNKTECIFIFPKPKLNEELQNKI